LAGSPWYNDFVLKSGVADIYGMRLFENAAHQAFLGVHQGLSRRCALRISALRDLVGPLSQAAGLHATLRAADRRIALAFGALDRMTAGVVITDGEARVVEINRAAESILGANDGLSIRNGRLGAVRPPEDTTLKRMIATATGGTMAGAGRLLVRKRRGPDAYALTVAPLSEERDLRGRPMVMIVLIDPDASSPSEAELAELYGLSPAESRLSAALSAGKTLSEIATESEVRITTLRTQLRSVLRKVGVERQADLVRVLARVHVAGPR
jgi:DNA-binding CsgD family transcriptional regulator/PAS domain-containing protein